MGNLEEELIGTARKRALDVMHRCATPFGFRASALAAGYPQIWGRDSVATLLGAAASQDADLIATGKASLETLGEHQTHRGMIPLNFNPDDGTISTENAGAVDSNLWFVLGHYLHYLLTHDDSYLQASWPKIERAMTWLQFQDMNECGLLEIPEAGNWMDLICVRYNTLYDNVLFYSASLAYQELCRRIPDNVRFQDCRMDAAKIHERINLLFWIDRCWVAGHFAEHLEKLKSIRLEWFMLYHNIGTISSRPYYLPWVAFREYGDWCDSLGNLLAILSGVADGHRSEHILRHMRQVGMAEPFPTKAIYPPIYPGEADWRAYYRSRNLNLPHQYHNGGIWSMIGGFHVAALVKHHKIEEARTLLVSLAKANRQGINSEWEFNEWLHGETGHPMGFGLQGWSASMFLYAEYAVRTGELPLFNNLLDAKPKELVAAEQNEPFDHPAGGDVG
jgi:hypothetical protein